jgi:hypothetical protein
MSESLTRLYVEMPLLAHKIIARIALSAGVNFGDAISRLVLASPEAAHHIKMIAQDNERSLRDKADHAAEKKARLDAKQAARTQQHAQEVSPERVRILSREEQIEAAYLRHIPTTHEARKAACQDF